MTKPTKNLLLILIILGMLGILAYGYYSIKKLDKMKLQAIETNITDYVYDESADTLYTEDEEGETDEETMTGDDNYEVYEEDGGWDNITAEPPVAESITFKNEEIDEKKELAREPVKPKSAPKPTVDTDVNDSSNSGKYLVIVGSYKSKKNAGNKSKSLEKIGLKGEVIQLDNSSLYLVVAGRFSNESDAENLKEKLINEHDYSGFVKHME